jgi:hypothetical protein
MGERSNIKLGLAVTLLLCNAALADYSISPFPANSILGPDGPVVIPSVVQQLLQPHSDSSVVAVNREGQFTGFYVTGGIGQQVSSVFVYLPTAADGVSAGIHLIPTAYTPTAINNSGQISGTYADAWGVWNINGNAITLPQSMGLAGLAAGINDLGQTVMQDFGEGSFTNYVSIWSPVTTPGFPQGLTALTPNGANRQPFPDVPNAVGINNIGDVVYNAGPTGTAFDNNFTVTQAYLRVAVPHDGLNAGTISLESADGGVSWDMYEALSLNQAGNIVGMASFGPSGSSYNAPALWTPSGGAVDLNTLLPANSGWVLQTVSQIDDLGDIEGTGLFNGVPTTFLLSVPEPAALSLGLLSVEVLARRKRYGAAANHPLQHQ